MDFKKKITEYIDKNYTEKYREIFEEKELIEDIDRIIDEMFSEFKYVYAYDIKAIIDKYDLLINDRVDKTKSRWVKKELEGKGSLNTELEMAKTIHSKVNDKFYDVYNFKTIEELKEKREDELNEWIKEDVELLSFMYAEDKKRFQLERAAINDIYRITIKHMKVVYNEAKQESVVELPKTVGSFPINFSQDKKLDIVRKADEDLDGFEGAYFQNLYLIDNDNIFSSIMSAEIVQDNTISKVLKDSMMSVLNSKDLKAFIYILSRREANFFTDRTITIPLIDIIENVYSSNNSHYYKKCRSSLHKMAHIRVSILDKKHRGITTGIFDKVQIGSISEGEQDFARIIVSETIVDDFLKRQTINLYSDSLSKLKQPISQVLIFKLQSTRIHHLAKESHEEPVVVDMSFFRSACFFNNKRDDRNAKAVEKALKEMINIELVVDRYERYGYNFHIYFLPFTDSETADLLDKDKALQNGTFDAIDATKQADS